MRTIIAGSRGFNNMFNLAYVMDHLPWTPSVVLSGTARGADKMGESWANINNIPVERYPAKWDVHGKSAGYIRNAEMAAVADLLVAFWDMESRGTKHMIDLALKNKLNIVVWNYKP